MLPKKYQLISLMAFALLFSAACKTLQFDSGGTGLSDEAISVQVVAVREMALTYLAQRYGDEAPPQSVQWAGRIVTQAEREGVMSYLFTAGEWNFFIFEPLAVPDGLVYSLSVYNPITGFNWQGEVDADLKVIELNEEDSVVTQPLETPAATVTVTPPPMVRLPMDAYYHSQIYETDLGYACGPASALMVLDYFGIEDDLDEVIYDLRNPPGPGGYDPTCTANPVCTSPRALVDTLTQTYGLNTLAREGWTLPEVYAALASGHPLIADIFFQLVPQAQGHFVVIYGVDLVNEVVYYQDPYDGKGMTALWDDFARAWAGPVDVGDPLQPQGYYFWGVEVSEE